MTLRCYFISILNVADSSYFPGRCAEVMVKNVCIGHLGILHPDVIAKFDLTLPCAALEINIETFV